MSNLYEVYFNSLPGDYFRESEQAFLEAGVSMDIIDIDKVKSVLDPDLEFELMKEYFKDEKIPFKRSNFDFDTFCVHFIAHMSMYRLGIQ
jgi:hypothetical protein